MTATKDVPAGKEFLREVANRLNAAPPFPSCATTLKKVVTAIAVTSVRRLTPLQVLIEGEHWSEAAMVARSLIELDIAASYILSADETEVAELAARFEKFEVVQRKTRVDRALAQDPNLPSTTDAPHIEALAKAHDAVVAEFTDIAKSVSRGWSGLGIAGMAQHIKPGPSQGFFAFAHRHAYPLYCDFAHPSPIGVRHWWPGIAEPWPESLTWTVPRFSAYCAVRLHSFGSMVHGLKLTPSIIDLEQRYMGDE